MLEGLNQVQHAECVVAFLFTLIRNSLNSVFVILWVLNLRTMLDFLFNINSLIILEGIISPEGPNLSS